MAPGLFGGLLNIQMIIPDTEHGRSRTKGDGTDCNVDSGVERSQNKERTKSSILLNWLLQKKKKHCTSPADTFGAEGATLAYDTVFKPVRWAE